jgi:hypothetical protein
VAIHRVDSAPSQPSSPLERLIRARGLRRFGLFFVAGEDELLPNGDVETSGYVIDEHSQIYSFWTGWDADHNEVIFSEWELVDEEAEWRGVGEYERARATAGLLPSTMPKPV